MTRETKLGLVVGLAFIVLFAVIISEGGGNRVMTPARFGAAEQARLADARSAMAGPPGVASGSVDRLNPNSPAAANSAPPSEHRPPAVTHGVSQDPRLAGLPVLPRETIRTGPTRPSPNEAVAMRGERQTPSVPSPQPSAARTEPADPTALAMKSSPPTNEPLVPRPIDSSRPASLHADRLAGRPALSAAPGARSAAEPQEAAQPGAAPSPTPNNPQQPNAAAVADARQPQPAPSGLANIERKLDELAQRTNSRLKNEPLLQKAATPAAGQSSAPQTAAAPSATSTRGAVTSGAAANGPPLTRLAGERLASGPSVNGSAATAGRARPTYEIQNGDSLFKIARKQYGTTRPAVINALYEANRHVLDSRHALKVGTKIVVPAVDGLAPREALTAVTANGANGSDHATSGALDSAALAAARPVGPPIIPQAIDQTVRPTDVAARFKPAGSATAAPRREASRDGLKPAAIASGAKSGAGATPGAKSASPSRVAAKKGKLAAELASAEPTEDDAAIRLSPAVPTADHDRGGLSIARGDTSAVRPATLAHAVIGPPAEAARFSPNTASDGIVRPLAASPVRGLAARGKAAGKAPASNADHALASNADNAAAVKFAPSGKLVQGAPKPILTKPGAAKPLGGKAGELAVADAGKSDAGRTEAGKTDAAKSKVARRSYVVRKNDTLRRIAARELGDAELADAIYRMNRGRMKTPHALKPGMKLQLPPHETASGAAQS